MPRRTSYSDSELPERRANRPEESEEENNTYDPVLDDLLESAERLGLGPWSPARNHVVNGELPIHPVHRNPDQQLQLDGTATSSLSVENWLTTSPTELPMSDENPAHVDLPTVAVPRDHDREATLSPHLSELLLRTEAPSTTPFLARPAQVPPTPVPSPGIGRPETRTVSPAGTRYELSGGPSHEDLTEALEQAIPQDSKDSSQTRPHLSLLALDGDILGREVSPSEYIDEHYESDAAACAASRASSSASPPLPRMSLPLPSSPPSDEDLYGYSGDDERPRSPTRRERRDRVSRRSSALSNDVNVDETMYSDPDDTFNPESGGFLQRLVDQQREPLQGRRGAARALQSRDETAASVSEFLREAEAQAETAIMEEMAASVPSVGEHGFVPEVDPADHGSRTPATGTQPTIDGDIASASRWSSRSGLQDDYRRPSSFRRFRPRAQVDRHEHDPAAAWRAPYQGYDNRGGFVPDLDPLVSGGGADDGWAEVGTHDDDPSLGRSIDEDLRAPIPSEGEHGFVPEIDPLDSVTRAPDALAHANIDDDDPSGPLRRSSHISFEDYPAPVPHEQMAGYILQPDPPDSGTEIEQESSSSSSDGLMMPPSPSRLALAEAAQAAAREAEAGSSRSDEGLMMKPSPSQLSLRRASREAARTLARRPRSDEGLIIKRSHSELALEEAARRSLADAANEANAASTQSAESSASGAAHASPAQDQSPRRIRMQEAALSTIQGYAALGDPVAQRETQAPPPETLQIIEQQRRESGLALLTELIETPELETTAIRDYAFGRQDSIPISPTTAAAPEAGLMRRLRDLHYQHIGSELSQPGLEWLVTLWHEVARVRSLWLTGPADEQAIFNAVIEIRGRQRLAASLGSSSSSRPDPADVEGLVRFHQHLVFDDYNNSRLHESSPSAPERGEENRPPAHAERQPPQSPTEEADTTQVRLDSVAIDGTAGQDGTAGDKVGEQNVGPTQEGSYEIEGQ